ncbi:lysylphosphatidylglycerol synthase transmembrane domain-containing protein [Dongia sp. agr-C8]
MTSVDFQDGKRGRLLGVLKLVVSAVVLWLVFRSVDAGDVWNRFRDADPSWTPAAFLALLLHFVVMVWRWNFVLVHFYQLRLGMGRLSLVFGLGEALGPILPSFVGIDLVRTFALAGSARIPTIAKAVLLDRIIGLVALLLLIALTLPGFYAGVDTGSAFLVVAVLSLGGLAAYVIGLWTSPLVARIPVIGRSAAALLDELKRPSQDLKAMAVLLCSGLLVHVASVAILWTAIRMLNGSVGFWPCLLIAPAAILIASIPISLGGWGLREGALVAGFTLVGVSPDVVVAASVLYGVSGIASGVIGLGLFLILPNRKQAAETEHG